MILASFLKSHFLLARLLHDFLRHLFCCLFHDDYSSTNHLTLAKVLT